VKSAGLDEVKPSRRRVAKAPADDPVMMARFIWALVHGVAMLGIDGQLGGFDETGTALIDTRSTASATR
jgi:Tetracyclin repressor-like, C-terminal domain